MPGFNDTLRSFGHGVERVLNRAIDGNDSDDEFCPNVPPSQTFSAVHERHRDFIDRIERGEGPGKSSDLSPPLDNVSDIVTTQSIREVSLGDAPSPERKNSPKTPAIPDVLNGQPAISPFALKRSPPLRKSADSKRTSDGSDKTPSDGGDVHTELPARNVAGGAAEALRALAPSQRASSLISETSSQGDRPSFDNRRGPSIEVGAPNPRNLRSAIQLGSQPRTESQTLGAVDEILAGHANRVVRRRVVLPYQVTLAFGVASIIGVGIGVGILAVSIRNAAYLRGPKSGPQLPEIRDLIYRLANDTQAIRKSLGV